MSQRNVRENRIQGPVVRKARRAGYLVRKLVWQGRTSAPDMLFVGFGRMALIEFKRPGGVFTPKQEKEFMKFRKAGYRDVHFCDDVDMGLRILNIPTQRTA